MTEGNPGGWIGPVTTRIWASVRDAISHRARQFGRLPVVEPPSEVKEARNPAHGFICVPSAGYLTAAVDCARNALGIPLWVQ